MLPYSITDMPFFIPVVSAILNTAPVKPVVTLDTLFNKPIGWYGLYLATDISLSLV